MFMRSSILFFVCCFLTACGSTSFSNITWDKSAFYKLNDGKAYFEYPVEALLRTDFLEYQGCRVNFKSKVAFEEEADKVRDGGVKYEVWYDEARLWRYHAFVKEFDYSFYVESEVNDVGGCVAFVERLAKSMSADKVFTSDRFDFSLSFPDGYEVEYLENGEGIVLSKESAKITVQPMKNEQGYDDFKEFVAEKYQGYTMEFRNFSGVSGVFVNEWKNGNAVRHFFAMLPGEDYLFATKLEVNSKDFALFEGDFNRMIEGVQVF